MRRAGEVGDDTPAFLIVVTWIRPGKQCPIKLDHISFKTAFGSNQAVGFSNASFAGNCGGQRDSGEQTGTFDHRMTSSARSNTDCGIMRPSALAVLRLITSSNLVGCSTGSSAGFAPLKILSTKLANR